MKGWSDVWNANDAQMLRNYSANDAVMLMWGRQMMGIVLIPGGFYFHLDERPAHHRANERER
ncbi:hypothetical protein HC174_04855 [Salinimicrobium sp. CDJ15-81-2]|nr:hypothetical protein [Salinimicrobium nanhaiense]